MILQGPKGRQFALAAVGALVVALGVLLPDAWYDGLPTNPEVPPPPFRGVSLFRGVLAVQGILLIGLAWRGRAYAALDPADRLPMRLPTQAGDGIGPRRAGWLLAAITILALLLRGLELGSDFWIDEVRATLDATELSTLAVIGSYVRSNVHVLNTLLMKSSIAVFGESEWSARLPAVLFGTATVPALYWVGRLVASRGVSLGAALLLAVSYHHVFFSQNARGYAPYLFFSLVASALLVQGLRGDRLRTWVLYALTMVLNFASILISGFVFAAHLLVGGAALVVLRVRGRSPTPLLRRLALVFGVTALLGFQLYSVQLPQVMSYINASYVNPSSGYALFSTEFLTEMARGLSAGFGPGLLLGALPFLLLAGVGFVAFLRRQWVLASALSLPLVLTALLLVVRGLTVSPRFFLLGLPVAVLTAVIMVDETATLVARRAGWSEKIERGATAATVLLLAVASLASLGPYYAVPKQPYRASLGYAAELRQEGEIVIAIHAARSGSAYYGAEMGLVEGRDLFLVDTLEALDAVLSGSGSRGALLLTTMPRALHYNRPDLAAFIEERWRRARTFPATIGDGQISVWTARGR